MGSYEVNKYSQKRRILPKDWPIHQETAEKHWQKEEEKGKMNKSRTTTINTFLFSLFYIVYFVTFVSQTNAHKERHWFCRYGSST